MDDLPCGCPGCRSKKEGEEENEEEPARRKVKAVNTWTPRCGNAAVSNTARNSSRKAMRKNRNVFYRNRLCSCPSRFSTTRATPMKKRLLIRAQTIPDV